MAHFDLPLPLRNRKDLARAAHLRTLALGPFANRAASYEEPYLPLPRHPHDHRTLYYPTPPPLQPQIQTNPYAPFPDLALPIENLNTSSYPYPQPPNPTPNATPYTHRPTPNPPPRAQPFAKTARNLHTTLLSALRFTETLEASFQLNTAAIPYADEEALARLWALKLAYRRGGMGDDDDDEDGDEGGESGRGSERAESATASASYSNSSTGRHGDRHGGDSADSAFFATHATRVLDAMDAMRACERPREADFDTTPTTTSPHTSQSHTPGGSAGSAGLGGLGNSVGLGDLRLAVRKLSVGFEALEGLLVGVRGDRGRCGVLVRELRCAVGVLEGVRGVWDLPRMGKERGRGRGRGVGGAGGSGGGVGSGRAESWDGEDGEFRGWSEV